MTAEATSPPALAPRGVALLLDHPLGDERRGWLRDHLGALPVGVTTRVVTVAPRSVRDGATWDDAWADELREVTRLLGRDDGARRAVVGEFDAAAAAHDDGATLTVVLDDAAAAAPGAAWALRRARGPTLILPAGGPLARAPGPRALLVVRAPDEAPALVACVGLLAPGVEVVLQGVVGATSESPLRTLADLEALEGALRVAAAHLSRSSRRVTTAPLVTDEDVEDDASTLVVRVARRGALRGLLPGPDARARRRRPRPRLLVPRAGSSSPARGG